MGGGQGECEQRFEVFVKMQKKIRGEGGGGRSGSGRIWGGGGSGWISEVFVKIQKKKFGDEGERVMSGEGGFRVDVIEEVKFL